MCPSNLGEAVDNRVTLVPPTRLSWAEAHIECQGRKKKCSLKKAAKRLTLLPNNFPDPVEKSFVLGVGGGLVMNELHLRRKQM